MRKELLCIFFIVSFCLLILSLQFLLDIFRTPSGSLYMGTIHYAPDYFNYLSWIVQGEQRVLSSTLLYSTELVPANLSRWEFVLLGSIFSKLGLNSIHIYHIAVFVFRIFFLLCAYLVIRLFYPQSRFKRVLTFFFFVTITAWPIVQFTDTGIHFGYHYFWYNTGNFFARFGPTPNHLLGSALLALTFYLFLTFKKRVVYIIFLPVTSFLLASISPVHWVLVTAAGFLTSVIYLIGDKLFLKGSLSLNKILVSFLPALLLFCGGILPSLYLQNLYSTVPYTLVTAWESGQRLPMDAVSFFYANGLISVFLLLGIFPFLKEIKRERVFSVVFVCICLFLYVSMFHQRLGIMNVRFWPQAVYVFIAIIATYGIFSFSRLFGKLRDLVLIFLVLFYTASTSIAIVGQLRDEIKSKGGDAMVYLPKEVHETYMFAKQNIPSSTVFLVQWPFNQSFPALTGKTSFYGDPVSNMTVDAYQKSQFTVGFLDGKLSSGEVQSFMRRYNVSHVLAYKGLPYMKYPFLYMVYETDHVGLYEVRL